MNKTWQKVLTLTLALVLALPAMAAEKGPSVIMAKDPESLIKAVTGPAYLTPDKYSSAMEQAKMGRMNPIGLSHLPQLLDLKTDPRRDITSDEIAGYAKTLVGFSEQSRRDGQILWGRIEGTKYERAALDWIEKTLRSFGLKDVHRDRFSPYEAIWFPSLNRLEIQSGPDIDSLKPYVFAGAITPFPSAVTPPEGVQGEAIYVGEGTAAELAGRDLTNKIVLVRARTEPSALFSPVRVAFSRIATGVYGRPAGIVVWWSLSGVKQVAGRVGAPGGGDQIGEALPWISINNDEGFYLRKVMDRATPDKPVRLKLVVQGRNIPANELESGNTYAFLPGMSGKYILIHTHVDSYFYGLHDNGGSIAAHLAIAKHYAKLPIEKRPHGFVFLFQGGHERTGVGGTRDFAKRYPDLLRKDLLMATRFEHFGLTQQLLEGFVSGPTNVASPLFLTVSNRSPVLIKMFKEAANRYGIVMGDIVSADMPTDELAFYSPYNNLGNPVFAGWVQTGTYYHTTADVDLGAISFYELARIARAMASIFDGLGPMTLKDLRKDEVPPPAGDPYTSPMFKLFLGNF